MTLCRSWFKNFSQTFFVDHIWKQNFTFFWQNFLMRFFTTFFYYLFWEPILRLLITTFWDNFWWLFWRIFFIMFLRNNFAKRNYNFFDKSYWKTFFTIFFSLTNWQLHIFPTDDIHLYIYGRHYTTRCILLLINF